MERTSHGITETNPYSKLFEGRIVFLGTPVDDASAGDVMAQLICLESIEPDQPIETYINSPGGSITAMAAIYDTMQYIRPAVHTYCLGQAASAAAVLLAAGAAGHRAVVPSARCLIHQPSMDGVSGPGSDLQIQAAEGHAHARVHGIHAGRAHRQNRRAGAFRHRPGPPECR